jgi:hypothetical protein
MNSTKQLDGFPRVRGRSFSENSGFRSRHSLGRATPDRPGALIHALGSLCTTTTCRPRLRCVMGLRSYSYASGRVIYARSCKRTSMRRHCLSSRRGGLEIAAGAVAVALCAMLLSALPRSHTLLGGSVHLMRSVFSGYRRCNVPSGLSSCSRVDRVRLRSRLMLEIRSAISGNSLGASPRTRRLRVVAAVPGSPPLYPFAAFLRAVIL